MSEILKHIISSVLLFFVFNASSQDYLESTTIIGSGVTTNNSKAWTDVTSVTIDVTDISNLLITASINMRTDGAHIGAREGNYNIYRSDDSTDKSGIIKRQMKANSEAGVESWGIGTLVHIFDVSLLTGDKTFIIEHSNNGGTGVNRNVYSSIQLTAVALTTELNSKELSNSVKRLDADVTTTSATYAAVAGLTTDAITLPINGDIFVLASINGKADGSAVAEYKLQSSDDGGSTWSDLGKLVKRSMINTWDDGIVSLIGLLQGQTADTDFMIRVAHKRESGSATITTHFSNLIAIALAHSGATFNAFSNSVGATGVDITGVSTSPTDVLTTNITTESNISGVGPKLFVSSQYLVNSTNLDASASPDQRMRASNQLYINDGTTTTKADEYFRYIPSDGTFGSGGFIGLTGSLTENTAYTVGMEHSVDYVSNPDATEDETLTTSNVILMGFQTYEKATALPIKLLYFNTTCSNDSKVNLKWATASEENNDYFTIKRSDDGISWSDITQIQGAGNSSSVRYYEYNDEEPTVHDTYYKIKQTDFDGKSEEFNIVAIYCKCNHKRIKLFPNPAKDHLTFSFYNKHHIEEKLVFHLYNNTGQLCYSHEEFASKNDNALKIDLPQTLKHGTYFLQILLNDIFFHTDVIIIKNN